MKKLSKSEAEILSLTFNQMADEFTSNEFFAQTVKNGMEKSYYLQVKKRKFLLKNAIPLSKKTWKKKVSGNNSAKIQGEITDKDFLSAVEIVKSRGCKILMPPNQQWIEI